jgi:hypothetical protein
MTGKSIAVALAMAGAVICASGSLVFAAGEGGPKETFVGRFVSTTPSCPSFDFHVVEGPGGKLQGMAFDPTMSGQMSTITGEVSTDGKAHLTMTAMGGNGPSGAVDGTMQNGNLALSMMSATCPMPKVMLMPVQKMFSNEGHG